MLQYFIDRAPGSLGRLQRTPQGGYVAPAAIARPGVMLYSADAMRAQGYDVPASIPKGGVVRVYLPEEVIKDAMPSLRAAPVTNNHPSRMVSPETWSASSRGNVLADTVTFDGMLKCDLAIQDAGLLREIELEDKREVSAGYHAATDFAAGTTPDGEAYDAIRTQILYNHVAVVKKGRAGVNVCLALDSEDIPTEEVSVKIKVKGVELDVELVQAAVDALEGELAGALSQVTDAQAKLDSEKAARLQETSDEALDARIQSKLDAEKAASEKAARLQAVKDAHPTMDLADKSDDFIGGLYASLKLAQDADPDDVKLALGERGEKVPGQAAQDAVDADKPKLSARAKMKADLAALAKR